MKLKTIHWIETIAAAALLGLLLAVSVPRFLEAQNVNTQRNFPDPNFRRAVEAFMGVGEGGHFTARQAAEKTGRLTCAGLGVEDMTGVGFFHSIARINCSNNFIKRLDLTNQAELDSLDCSLNSITELILPPDAPVTILMCNQNELTGLDVSGYPGLILFRCFGNRIARLDVSSNAQLVELLCGNNELEELRLDRNPALKVLHCYGNNLQSVDVNANPALERLDVSDNRLIEVPDLLSHRFLMFLDIRNNYLLSDACPAIQRLQENLTLGGQQNNPMRYNVLYQPQKSAEPLDCGEEGARN